MEFSYSLILIVGITFLVSIIYIILVTPIIRKYAIKNNLFDYPDVRKQRTSNRVRLGGLSIITGFLISICLFLILHNFLNLEQISFNNLPTIILGSILFFLIGFVDDLYNLSPWPKLFLQVFFSLIIFYQKISIQNISLSFLFENSLTIPTSISLILTVLWVGAITNSVNWLDGLDGLAVGVSAICFVPISILNFLNGNYDIAIASIIIIGLCLAFLRYNYKPSKILMGDGGAYFLGINLASMSLLAGQTNTQTLISNSYTLDILCIFLIVALPFFDLLRVISTRIKNGLSPFFPDRKHLHHKLVDKGIKEGTSVKILYFISVISGSLVLLYKGVSVNFIILIFSILALTSRIILLKRH